MILRKTFKERALEDFQLRTQSKQQTAHAAMRRIDGLLKMPSVFLRSEHDEINGSPIQFSQSDLKSEKQFGLVRKLTKQNHKATWEQVFSKHELEDMRLASFFKLGEPSPLVLADGKRKINRIVKHQVVELKGYQHRPFNARALAAIQTHSFMGVGA
jgi:hypothetical protein